VLKIAVEGTLDGEEYVSTLYAHKIGAWTLIQIDDMIAAIGAEYSSHFQQTAGPQLTLTQIVGTDLTSADGFQSTFFFASPLTGTEGGPRMPNSAAKTISFTTGRAGRSTRGRNKLGGLTGDLMSDENHVNTTYETYVRTLYDGIQNAITDAGYEFVVLSRVADGVERAEGVTYSITQIGFNNNRLDSQRRRLPGRGA